MSTALSRQRSGFDSPCEHPLSDPDRDFKAIAIRNEQSEIFPPIFHLQGGYSPPQKSVILPSLGGGGINKRNTVKMMNFPKILMELIHLKYHTIVNNPIIF